MKEDMKTSNNIENESLCVCRAKPIQLTPCFDMIAGTYRLDIRERTAEPNDITTALPSLTGTSASSGEGSHNGREMLYAYDSVDTGLVPSGDPPCKVNH